jgi:hypothetical protein
MRRCTSSGRLRRDRRLRLLASLLFQAVWAAATRAGSGASEGPPSGGFCRAGAYIRSDPTAHETSLSRRRQEQAPDRSPSCSARRD